MNLALIGYRGTGKTSVARLLGSRFAMPWIDSDEHIELRAGKSIADIFAADGEEHFRDLESKVIAEFARNDRCILALGGGAVLRPENREAICAAAKVVWLQASPETLLERLAGDPLSAQRRPNLTTAGGLDEIIATLAKRTPIYRQCADLEVDTEGKTPAQVADEIMLEFGPLLDPPKSA